jgi:hypothetical protein
MNNLLKKRFEELTEQAKKVEGSKKSFPGIDGSPIPYFDSDRVLTWAVKAKSLLSNACGKESSHLVEFNKADVVRSYEDGTERFKRMKAVFLAAKEDYEGGYLVSMRTMVQSEVFSSELEQATELLKNGYSTAAAVIAGVVLETTIRDLCTKHGISHGKLDKMNADLAKASVYNSIVQKRVTHLAAIRNSAAHGNQAEFKTYDVAAMIDEIEQFLANHLT